MALRAFFPLVVALAFGLGGCKTPESGSAVKGDEVAPVPAVAKVSTLADLKAKTADELFVMFRDANGDIDIPIGHGTGYPILMAQNTTLNALANKVWGGKEFKKDVGPDGAEVVTLKNFIGPLTVIRAKVFKGLISDARPTLSDSVIDSRPSIVLNYSDVTMGALTPFNRIVDEIRVLNPETKLYLGRAFLGETFVCYFALQFTD